MPVINNFYQNHREENRNLVIPQYGVVLDASTAYIRSVLSDGIELGRGKSHYFVYGDKNQAYQMISDDLNDLRKHWGNFIQAINQMHTLPCGAEIPAKETTKKLFKESGSEILRKILNE